MTPDELVEHAARLKAALVSMIDLAEFWIERDRRLAMSQEQYEIWLALGHRSSAMLEAYTLLATQPLQKEATYNDT